jgi:NAD(P)-dependent dehydrogenase (short-subunit alcohol dehydrogenase family)
MDIALITGASRGLGLALAQALADRGYGLAIDARGSQELEGARALLAERTAVTALAGDVADPRHREQLIAAAVGMGRLRLLVNNASVLGPSPQPDLRDYPLEVLDAVYRINVLAPLGLIQLALPVLAPEAVVVNITSDAAVENYPGWGGYGSSKAALEQLSNVLAAELDGVRVYWADPGDMRTRMHQEAFPGEDISDRPRPEASVPGLLRLIAGDLPSGRYRARELSRSEAAA